jgi:P-type conjugative transfer protein TrbJ
MRKSKAIAIVAALTLLGAPAPAQAMTVFDPTNYAQNILQASRALDQIHNQIQQIEQQAQMLAQNPLQLSPQLTQSISDARQLFSTAQGLTFEVDHLSDQLKTLYPDTWSNFDLGQVGAKSDQWLQEDRAALDTAIHAQAQATAALTSTQGQVDRALQSSTVAQGETGAVQASNQLLGIQTAQLAQIQSLLLAQSRMLSDERLEQVARAQRAEAIRAQAFPGNSSPSFTPARSAFGE